jgi:predicted Zn-dependent protease
VSDDKKERVEDVAARVLAAAKPLAAGADVMVHVRRRSSANVRYARNEITTSGEGDDASVSVWIGIGKRHAEASTNQTDAASIERLVQRAVTMAKLSPEDPERMPLLPPQTYAAAPPAFDERLATTSPGDRAAIASRGIAEADAAKVQIAGFFVRNAAEEAIASSTGLTASRRETDATYTVTARTTDATGSGWGGREVHRASDLDDLAIAKTAIDKAVRSASPKPLAPGKYTVILEPVAVQEMLTFLVGAMDRRSADEGRSFFAGKAGAKVFADMVTLKSDPLDAETPGSPFDGDGLPLRAQTWIDGGVVKDLHVSRYWAQKKGLTPTGWHTVHRLVPPASSKDASIDDLVKGTKRGLLVTRFWYTRMLEPQTVMLTGLTRDGVFLVEDGKIKHPVTNFRYNESPVTVLKNVEAMTRGTVRVPSYGGVWHVPALRTREFTMASVSAAV